MWAGQAGAAGVGALDAEREDRDWETAAGQGPDLINRAQKFTRLVRPGRHTQNARAVRAFFEGEPEKRQALREFASRPAQDLFDAKDGFLVGQDQQSAALAAARALKRVEDRAEPPGQADGRDFTPEEQRSHNRNPQKDYQDGNDCRGYNGWKHERVGSAVRVHGSGFTVHG